MELTAITEANPTAPKRGKAWKPNVFLEENPFKNSKESLTSEYCFIARNEKIDRKVLNGMILRAEIRNRHLSGLQTHECQLVTPYIITKVHSIYSRLRKLKIGLLG